MVTTMEEASATEGSVDTLARTRTRILARPWMQTFVDALRDTPVVAMACKAAAVSRTIAYRVRGEDEDFREEWDAALEDGWEGVEDVALRMARAGSERLIEFLLRGNKAKTYRETHKVEVEHGLSAGMEDVLRAVRMRRQEQLTPSNVRELPVTDVKSLTVNDTAQDGESCEGQKAPESGA